MKNLIILMLLLVSANSFALDISCKFKGESFNIQTEESIFHKESANRVVHINVENLNPVDDYIILRNKKHEVLYSLRCKKLEK